MVLKNLPIAHHRGRSDVSPRRLTPLIARYKRVPDPIMADVLKLTDRVAQGRKQLAAEAAGSVMLMNVDHGVYCGLDDIGSDIWRRLVQPMTIAALCDALAADYRGDRDQIAVDVLELLSSLRAQGLIDVV